MINRPDTSTGSEAEGFDMLTFFQTELNGLVSSAKIETLNEILAGLNLGIKMREDGLQGITSPDEKFKTQAEINVLKNMETWLEQFQDKLKQG